MDKLAGALDRLAPGLGDVARTQAGANLSLGLNLIGEQTTLEGRRALTLPLRFSDGDDRFWGRSRSATRRRCSNLRPPRKASAAALRQTGMRAAEIRRRRILADIDDALADGARARELLEQRLAVAVADRLGQR